MTVSQAPLSERPIRYVKGVGPHRMSQLAQLGIETIEDLCYYPPRRYEDRTRLLAIRDATPGEMVTVRGRVLARGLRRLPRGQTIVEAAIGDGSGIVYGVWFNQPYLAQHLTMGEELILYGRLELRPRPQLVHPELERVGEGSDNPSAHMGRIVPIYPLAGGLSQRWFRQVVWTALEQHSAALEEVLPAAICQARRWPSRSEAIRALHFPPSWEALEAARARLAFEELFVFQLTLAQRRMRAKARTKPQRYQLDGPLTQGLRQRLPFALTASQQRVVEELLRDVRQPTPMHRLLQGDVGCGKTVVMLVLMAVAVQSGYQVALMAPTELLVEQHARVVAEFFGPLGVSIGVLSQGTSAIERTRRLEAIEKGNIAVVIGTHALIQRHVAFQRLALVLIDEQHKFGVVQRSHLAKKAEVPDVLVVTATPIPRTLALSLYGDLDVSTIDELPAGRRPITTLWMREAQREELYALVRQHLAQGRQGYVVYPLIHEGSVRELKAASQMAKRLQAVSFPDFCVGLLHGEMKPKDKERTMQAFVKGELHLLVSTVIVEVGLDIPNATIMVIEHPERFGLAQLHQLRGRIGRGEQPATCVVVSDARPRPAGNAGLSVPRRCSGRTLSSVEGSGGAGRRPPWGVKFGATGLPAPRPLASGFSPRDPESRRGRGLREEAVGARLRAFVETTDGFQLAEEDLALRGPGEFFGRRQHGWLRFRIADLSRDRAALEAARDEARALISRDPTLRDPAVSRLREQLARFRRG